MGIYPREVKTYIHTNTCTHVCIPALIIIAKNWKQRKCPSMPKQAGVHPYIGTVLSNKNEQTIDTYDILDDSLGNYDEWRTKTTSKIIQPMIPFI